MYVHSNLYKWCYLKHYLFSVAIFSFVSFWLNFKSKTTSDVHFETFVKEVVSIQLMQVN